MMEKEKIFHEKEIKSELKTEVKKESGNRRSSRISLLKSLDPPTSNIASADSCNISDNLTLIENRELPSNKIQIEELPSDTECSIERLNSNESDTIVKDCVVKLDALFVEDYIIKSEVLKSKAFSHNKGDDMSIEKKTIFDENQVKKEISNEKNYQIDSNVTESETKFIKDQDIIKDQNSKCLYKNGTSDTEAATKIKNATDCTTTCSNDVISEALDIKNDDLDLNAMFLKLCDEEFESSAPLYSEKIKSLPGMSYIIIFTNTAKRENFLTFDCVLCSPSVGHILSGTVLTTHLRSRCHLLNILKLHDYSMFEKYKKDRNLESALCNEVSICETNTEKQIVIVTAKTYSEERRKISTSVEQLSKNSKEIHHSLFSPNKIELCDIDTELQNTMPQEFISSFNSDLRLWAEKLAKIQKDRKPQKLVFLIDREDLDFETKQYGDLVKVVKIPYLDFENAIINLNNHNLIGKGYRLIILFGLYSFLNVTVTATCKMKKCSKPVNIYSVNQQMTSEDLISKALQLQEYVLSNSKDDQVAFCDIIPINISNYVLNKCENKHALRNDTSQVIYISYLNVIEEYNKFVNMHCQIFNFKNLNILNILFPLESFNITRPLDYLYDLSEVNSEQISNCFNEIIFELLKNMNMEMQNKPMVVVKMQAGFHKMLKDASLKLADSKSKCDQTTQSSASYTTTATLAMVSSNTKINTNSTTTATVSVSALPEVKTTFTLSNKATAAPSAHSIETVSALPEVKATSTLSIKATASPSAHSIKTKTSSTNGATFVYGIFSKTDPTPVTSVIETSVVPEGPSNIQPLSVSSAFKSSSAPASTSTTINIVKSSFLPRNIATTTACSVPRDPDINLAASPISETATTSDAHSNTGKALNSPVFEDISSPASIEPITPPDRKSIDRNQKVFDKIVIITNPQYTIQMESFRSTKVELICVGSSNLDNVFLVVKRRLKYEPERTLWIAHTGVFEMARVEHSKMCSSCVKGLRVVIPEQEYLTSPITHVKETEASYESLIKNVNKILNSDSAFIIVPPFPPTFLVLEESKHDLYHKIESERKKYYFTTAAALTNFESVFSLLSKRMISFSISELEKLNIPRQSIVDYSSLAESWNIHCDIVKYENVSSHDGEFNTEKYLHWCHLINKLLSENLEIKMLSEKSIKNEIKMLSEKSVKNEIKMPSEKSIKNEIKMPSEKSIKNETNVSLDMNLDGYSKEHVVCICFCQEHADLFPEVEENSNKFSVLILKKDELSVFETKMKIDDIVSSECKSILVIIVGGVYLVGKEHSEFYCTLKCSKPMHFSALKAFSVKDHVRPFMHNFRTYMYTLQKSFEGRAKVLLIPLMPQLCALKPAMSSTADHDRVHKLLLESHNPYLLSGETEKWDMLAYEFSKSWNNEMFLHLNFHMDFHSKAFLKDVIKEQKIALIPLIHWVELEDKFVLSNLRVMYIDQCKKCIKKFLQIACQGIRFKQDSLESSNDQSVNNNSNPESSQQSNINFDETNNTLIKMDDLSTDNYRMGGQSSSELSNLHKDQEKLDVSDPPGSFFSSNWKDLVVYGSQNSANYLCKAIVKLSQFSAHEKAKILFITTSSKLVDLTKGRVMRMLRSKAKKDKVVALNNSAVDLDFYDCYMGTPFTYINYHYKILQSANVKAIIVDNVLTMSDTMDLRLNLTSILRRKNVKENAAAINKVFVAESYRADVPEYITSLFGISLIEVKADDSNIDNKSGDQAKGYQEKSNQGNIGYPSNYSTGSGQMVSGYSSYPALASGQVTSGYQAGSNSNLYPASNPQVTSEYSSERVGESSHYPSTSGHTTSRYPAESNSSGNSSYYPNTGGQMTSRYPTESGRISCESSHYPSTSYYPSASRQITSRYPAESSRISGDSNYPPSASDQMTSRYPLESSIIAEDASYLHRTSYKHSEVNRSTGEYPSTSGRINPYSTFESEIQNYRHSTNRSISPSHVRYRSRSPSYVRYRSRSPNYVRYRSKSPSNVRYRSRSPSHVRYRSRSPSYVRYRSRSPNYVRYRGISPVNYQRSKSRESYLVSRRQGTRSTSLRRIYSTSRQNSLSPLRRLEPLPLSQRSRSRSRRQRSRSRSRRQRSRSNFREGNMPSWSTIRASRSGSRVSLLSFRRKRLRSRSRSIEYRPKSQSKRFRSRSPSGQYKTFQGENFFSNSHSKSRSRTRSKSQGKRPITFEDHQSYGHTSKFSVRISSEESNSSVIDSFSVIGTLEILDKVNNKLGMLSSVMTVLSNSIKSEYKNSRVKALNIIKEEENAILFQLVVDKLKALLPSAPLPEISSISKAIDWLTQLINFAKNAPQPEVSINIKAIAAASMNKTPNFTLNLIKTAFAYELENFNPSTEEINEIYLKVCALQCEMVLGED